MTQHQLPTFTDEKQGLFCSKCLEKAEAEAQLQLSTEKVKVDSDIAAHTNGPDSISSHIIHYKKDYATGICHFLALIAMAPFLILSIFMLTVPGQNAPNHHDTSSEISYQNITHSESWNYRTRFDPQRYTHRKV
ncbi:hypothetical protein BCON_0074g00350 [Botryotinia convoluta]|uniref:Transmembrane protein n=1 Tax=Botryotinia convoluta TaxID=54673 RepID=A0A4Z1I555_9HELO|nr:hypothetical protein BCON_0074g00350 [Botryotinia convoluta]